MTTFVYLFSTANIITVLSYSNCEIISEKNNFSLNFSPNSHSSSKRNSRRREEILFCLGIGHTCITHFYRIISYILTPQSFLNYKVKYITVHHFFSCPNSSPSIFRSMLHLPVSKPQETIVKLFLLHA